MPAGHLAIAPMMEVTHTPNSRSFQCKVCIAPDRRDEPTRAKAVTPGTLVAGILLSEWHKQNVLIEMNATCPFATAPRKYALIFPLFLAACIAGCTNSRPAASAAPATALSAAVAPPPSLAHYHFPGMSGPTWFDSWWCEAFDNGLADRHPGPMNLEVIDWRGGRRDLDALQAVQANHTSAKQIAQSVAERATNRPGERLLVTAQSAGCASAVWMLENLPDNIRVDSLVLIAPALSPGYDLSKALAHVRGRAYVFTNENDAFILGWGTRTYGTSDGLHVDGAGRRGFVQPPGADPTQYAKLRTLSYRLSWLWHADFGGHDGAMSPLFAHDVIAPLVAADPAVE